MGCALLKEQNVKGRKKEDVLRARKVDASRLLRRNELEHLVPQVTLLLLGKFLFFLFFSQLFLFSPS